MHWNFVVHLLSIDYIAIDRLVMITFFWEFQGGYEEMVIDMALCSLVAHDIEST